LKNTSLDNEEESLATEVLDQIRGPFQEPLTLDNPDEKLSPDLFLAVTNASEETYNSVCDGILTYYKVKRLVVQLTGIIPIIHDMCVNCCVGYTGHFQHLIAAQNVEKKDTLQMHPISHESNFTLSL